MTDEEINKINLAKYKENSKKGLILEVDVEYPKSVHDNHNEYCLAPKKMKVSNYMLLGYCQKTAKEI